MMHLLSSKGRPAGATVAVALLGTFVAIVLGSDNMRLVRDSPPRTFALGAEPWSRTIAPGSATRYRITIRRTRFRGRAVALWEGGGLPPHAYARFLPLTTRRSSATLIVTTSPRTRPGRYRLRLQATSGSTSRGIAVTLTIVGSRGRGVAKPTPSAPFRIGGNANNLELGVTQPLDLSLTNPNSVPLSVGSLIASAKSVDAPRATPSLPCTLADFSLQQFSGPYPVILPASSTRTLSALGLPSAEWPQLAILARPINQDGCQGATLNLSYSGNATLG
jgi:hypothetical protein